MKRRNNRVHTRREFIGAAVATSTIIAACPAILSQPPPSSALQARLAADPQRPCFHLLPAKNWMNDPNGPIFWNGRYHMFFQYNPHGATWGDMSWNHAISTDMIHWKLATVAMTPTACTADAFGCFSGTAVAIGSRVYFVYTGTVLSTPELATLRDGNHDILETQCLAWSDDARLRTFKKAGRPIIALPPPGSKVSGFRDPSVWKDGTWYYMTIGSGEYGVGGCVLLYRSPVTGDLTQWEYLHQLCSGPWNGKKAVNPCDSGEMWECPDFFALDGGHVLIYSTLGKVFWQSGDFDKQTLKFIARKTGLLDLDAFYAPKTQLDAAGRRILWGWIPERRSEDAMLRAGWSGMMSLPRVLTLHHDGTLRMRILPQLAVLRSDAVSQNASSAGKVSILPAATGEILCTGNADRDFSLTLNANGRTLLEIRYSAPNRSFAVDGHEVQLQPSDVPSVHLFADGSVLEMILGERMGYTKRFYDPSPQAPEIAVAVTGATLSSWSLHPISANRLTT